MTDKTTDRILAALLYGAVALLALPGLLLALALGAKYLGEEERCTHTVCSVSR